MTNPPAPTGAGGSGCEDAPIPGREASTSCVAEGTSPSGGLVEADGDQVLLAQDVTIT